MAMNPRLLRPTASGFDPRRIAGLQLWVDATVASSLTFNGTTISKFDDLSGNGRHFVQNVGGDQPTYGATLMNGRPGLQFTGSATSLMLSSATIADVFGTPTTSPQTTIFSVMRVAAGGNAATFGSDVSADGRLLLAVRFLGLTGGPVLLDIIGTAPGSGRQTFPISQAEAETAGLYRVTRSGGTQSAHRNGAQEVTGSQTGVFAATTAKMSIGRAVGLGGQSVFSSLLFYNRALSAAEASAVEKYLARIYGLTLA
jgi:hypothetical protein